MTARFIERARELERLADTRRIRDRLQAIFESDRWSTWDHYARTGRYVRDELLAAGAQDAEFDPLPADGRSLAGDWVMPLGWNATAGELYLSRNGQPRAEQLADF